MNEIVNPDSLIDARPENLTETFFGGCPHDCPDTCSMLFDVKDGRLLGVRGNPDHPMTRGGLCVKLKDYEKRHYHPDRLLYPMKRIGEPEDVARAVAFLASDESAWITGETLAVDGGMLATGGS